VKVALVVHHNRHLQTKEALTWAPSGVAAAKTEAEVVLTALPKEALTPQSHRRAG
jgi:hypothetical protein